MVNMLQLIVDKIAALAKAQGQAFADLLLGQRTLATQADVRLVGAKVDALGVAIGALKEQISFLSLQVRSNHNDMLNAIHDQDDVLEQIVDALIPSEATSILIQVEGFTQGEPVILTDIQKVSASIQPLNAKGNPATVDGVPVWASSNEAAATVEASADGMSAVITATGLGTTQISVTADADLGAGTRSITGVADIEVRASEAVTVGIVLGTPEEV